MDRPEQSALFHPLAAFAGPKMRGPNFCKPKLRTEWRSTFSSLIQHNIFEIKERTTILHNICKRISPVPRGLRFGPTISAPAVTTLHRIRHDGLQQCLQCGGRRLRSKLEGEKNTEFS